MKKKTGNKPRTKATIYIKYDAEKAENLIGYATRWDIRKAETLNISRFIRMLTEKYKVTKSAFHETSGIHNMAFNKYQNVPDNCCLSTEAIERIAVCILLLEPPLNVDPDFAVDCVKKKGGFHGVIANMSQKDIDDMREEFRKVFGTFGYHLTHTIKSLDQLNEMNVLYFNIFTNVNGKLKCKTIQQSTQASALTAIRAIRWQAATPSSRSPPASISIRSESSSPAGIPAG